MINQKYVSKMIAVICSILMLVVGLILINPQNARPVNAEGNNVSLEYDSSNGNWTISGSANSTNDHINIYNNDSSDNINVYVNGVQYWVIAPGTSKDGIDGYVFQAINHCSFTYDATAPNVYIDDYDYKITYDANDDNNNSVTGLPSDAKYLQDATASISQTLPTRNTYMFGGWNTLQNGTGTTYQVGDSYGELSDDITLYAVWIQIIYSEPDWDNEYTVSVDDSISGETYQWYKGVPTTYTNNFFTEDDESPYLNVWTGLRPDNSNNIESMDWLHQGEHKIELKPINVTTKSIVKFTYSGNNLVSGATLVQDHYEIEFNGEEIQTLQFSNNATITITEFIVYNSTVISGETNAQLSNITLENTYYYCKITLQSGETSVTRHLTPCAISFNSNGADTGVAPNTIYQFFNKTINLPTNTLTKSGYDFVWWGNNDTKCPEGGVYTVDDNICFNAVWGHMCNGIGFNIPLTQTMIDECITSDNHSLSGGNYYLTEDIILPTYLQIDYETEVNILLMGKTLDLGGLDSNGDLKSIGNFRIQNNGVMGIFDYVYTNENIKYFTVDSSGLWKHTDSVTDNYVYGGLITGGNAYDTDEMFVESGGAIKNVGKLTIKNINIVGNIAEENGGAIYNSNDFSGIHNEYGKVNIYHTTIKGNAIRTNDESVPNGDGGAIWTSGCILVQDSTISNNSANCGGGIYCDSTIVIVINSVISNNHAYTNGGGVYVNNPTGCLIAGTKVTMADGTTKNIESIVNGDMVRTFDHETGSISNERVCYVYKGLGKQTAFTLHFTNNIDLSVVAMHTFLEKSSLRYVTITENNANEYIGKYFYNANNARWERLQSVTKSSTLYDYYAITTAHHLNSVTNDMLSAADDTEYNLNTFDFDSNLQINQAKKQADIQKYGLFTYDKCPTMSQQDFDDYNIKYVNIIIGKGYATMADLIEMYRTASSYLNNVVTSSASVSNNTFSQSSSALLPTAIGLSQMAMIGIMSTDLTCDDFIEDVNDGTLIIGYGAQIINNTRGTSTNSNVYLSQGTYSTKISLVDNADASTISVGVEMSTNSGNFATDISSSNYLSCFTSDNASYEVYVRDIEGTPTTYNYSLELAYPVVYNLNQGGGTAPTDSRKYQAGDVITLPNGTGFTKSGYTFRGWSTASNALIGNTGSYTIQVSDIQNNIITFYAIWEKSKYVEDFEICISEITGAINKNDIVITLSDENLSVDGLFIVKITPGETDEDYNYEICSAIADAGLYYIIIIVRENGGKWFVADDTHSSSDTLYVGTITIGQDTYEGYVIDSANYNTDSIENYTTSSQDKYLNVLLEVSYMVNITNKTISFSGGNGVSGTAPDTQYETTGKTITLPANPFTKTNYNFVGWSDGTNTYQAETNYTVGDLDITLYAVWEIKSSITINETPQTFITIDNNIKFNINSVLQNFVTEYLVNGAWTTTTPTKAGVYDVKISRAEDDNFASYSRVISGGLVINKAPNNIDSLTQQDIVTGNKINPSAISTYGDIVYYYRLASDAEYVLLTEDNYPTEVGKYFLKAVVLASDNYESVESEIEFEIKEDTSIPIGVWIIIAVVALMAIAILIFFNTKRTITFIVDGKEFATIRAKQNANLNMYGELLSYIWYTDKNLTKVFMSNKVGYKNLTLYGQKSKGKKQ